jgi:hypothetical protein
LWEWTKEVQNRDEINNKYLSAIDDSELSAWQVEAKACNVELLEKMWEWAKKQQTAEELNYSCS